MWKPKQKSLRSNQNGIAAVEFGLIAPVVIIMLTGVMDIGHNYYVRTVLNGSMQEASRSSSLESAAAIVRQQQIDLRVNDAVKAVIPSAYPVDADGNRVAKDSDQYAQELAAYQEELAAWNAASPSTRGKKPEAPSQDEDEIFAERRFYKTFSEAASAQAENWTDSDGDGTCNNGEPYVDENSNEEWDEDGGTSGQGLAHDVVVMKVRIKYKRLFPAASILGFSDEVFMESDSVLANQPYSQQTELGAAVNRNCT